MNRTHFWIPAADPRAAEEELNQFIRAHRVLSVEEVFVSDGAGSAFAGNALGTGGGSVAAGTTARA
ncbi:MAG: hypothetical protein GY856_24480 [bacterium]|nr:hypothetical protein [bacterium]